MNNRHCAEVKKLRGDGRFLSCDNDTCRKVSLLTNDLQ